MGVNTWSERARKEACRRFGRDGHTVAQVASQFGVGWAMIMKAVTEYGQPALDDPVRLASVRTLGVDETAFTAAGPRRSTTFATGIVAAGRCTRQVRESIGPVDFSAATGLGRTGAGHLI